jgi:polar amino acid transport system permease protein
MTWYLGDLIPYMPLLLQGLWISIYISVLSFVFGSVLGLFAYLAKAGRWRVLRGISGAYIEVVRNVPLLVVLYLIYFGLTQFGVNLDPLWSTLIALTINNGAYVAEILRAGFESVPKGLREAAHALGMNGAQTFRYAILVPGIRNVFPAMTNQFILLFLFSSVASVIALPELTNQLLRVNSETLRTFEVFTVGALLYYVVSSVLALGSRLGEKRLFRW